MTALPYNAEALDTNKNGRLARSQISGFIPMILMGGSFLLIVAFLGVIATGGIYVFFTTSSPGAFMGLVWFVMFGVIALVVLWFVYLVAGKRIVDIVIGKVRQIEGPGTRAAGTGSRSFSGSSGGSYFLYTVGEMQFQISRKMYESLPEWDKKVRAYYTPLSKNLVNVESLSNKPA